MVHDACRRALSAHEDDVETATLEAPGVPGKERVQRCDNASLLGEGGHPVRRVEVRAAPVPALDFDRNRQVAVLGNHIHFASRASPVPSEDAVPHGLQLLDGAVFAKVSRSGAAFQNHGATLPPSLSRRDVKLTFVGSELISAK
jgi:hypothetical protein